MSRKPSPKTPSKAPVVTTTPAQATQKSGSFKDLLNLGTAQKCLFDYSIGEMSTQGTVYVNAGKMRGDFVANISGNKVNSHIITDVKTSYIWTDGQSTGLKMLIDPNAVKPTGTGSTQAFDPNQLVNYDCQSWSADATMFNPPENVSFSDLNSTACSACNNLSGEVKTRCLSALKCQ